MSEGEQSTNKPNAISTNHQNGSRSTTAESGVSPSTVPLHHRAWASLLNIAEAAVVASLFTKALLHPIDTIKVRIQSRPKFESRRELLFNGHLPSLYRGLMIKMLLYAPYQAAYMSSYTAAKDFLLLRDYGNDAVLDEFGTTATSTNDGETAKTKEQSRSVEPRSLSNAEVLACALAAECGSAAIRVPMEVIKIRVQCAQYSNTFGGIAELFRVKRTEAAMRGHQQPLSGMGATNAAFKKAFSYFRAQTLLYDLPYSCVQWLCYENLKPRVKSYFENYSTRLSTFDDDGQMVRLHWCDATVRQNIGPMMSGGVSGFVAAGVTIPVDVVRTRVHLASVEEAKLFAERGGLTRMVGDMVQREGVRCLFKGGGWRLLWVGSNMSVYFTTFEWLKRSGWH